MTQTLVEQPNPVCVGVDVGQIHDPSAIAVAEVVQVHTGKFRFGREFLKPAHVDEHMIFHKAQDADPVMRSRYIIRHIRRLPLGTSYPAVAMYIADMLCNVLFAHRDVRVLIDVTGVGRPVYDDLRLEIKRREATRHIQLKPITFSHGEKYNKTTGVMAKAYLVSRLQSLLQGEFVDGPDTQEMKATVEELRVYEIKVSDDGKDTYGATIGKHDDLATALGLACLEDPYSERVGSSQRVY
jgi:hypothetical protein